MDCVEDQDQGVISHQRQPVSSLRLWPLLRCRPGFTDLEKLRFSDIVTYGENTRDSVFNQTGNRFLPWDSVFLRTPRVESNSQIRLHVARSLREDELMIRSGGCTPIISVNTKIIAMLKLTEDGELESFFARSLRRSWKVRSAKTIRFY